MEQLTLPDAPSAFAAYEHLRCERVEKIAVRAAKINHAKTPGPVLRHRIDWDAVDPATPHRG